MSRLRQPLMRAKTRDPSARTVKEAFFVPRGLDGAVGIESLHVATERGGQERQLVVVEPERWVSEYHRRHDLVDAQSWENAATNWVVTS